LWFTAVPEPDQTAKYVAEALRGQQAGHMLPWVVRELTTNAIVGSTRYHDIVPSVDRVEIGYTWYAAQWQRSHVNTVCKLLLLGHAFETLGCQADVPAFVEILRGTAHYSFTDAPFLMPSLLRGTGSTLPAEEAQTRIVGMLIEFFDHFLRAEPLRALHPGMTTVP